MQKRQCRPDASVLKKTILVNDFNLQTYLILVMSLFVLDMNSLTLDDSASIEFRTGIIASAVLSIFLTVEQSEKNIRQNSTF